MHRFIGQGARARNDSDGAFFMNARGHDAQLAFAGGNNSGTVRADQARLARLQELPGPDHIQGGNAFGDADDQLDVGVGGFHDRVGGSWRRHKDDGRIGSRLFDGFADGVEYGPALVSGAAFARRDSAHDLRSVFRASLGVERAFPAGEALDDDSSLFVD